MSRAQPLPPGASRVAEVRVPRPASLSHPVWSERWPWLIQGTTVREGVEGPFDLGLFSAGSPDSEVLRNWSALARETGVSAVVHARQVHGCDVHTVAAPVEPAPGRAGGLRPGGGAPMLLDPADGHVTDRPGVLLAVTAADCVPVFVVDPVRRAIGALHAGWRGAAAGMLEHGLRSMEEAFDSDRERLHMHLGPSICGVCYEVGPEVFVALGLDAPTGPTPIDLRAALAHRAVRAGVRATSISVSTHCTRCTGSGLFSHRGGDAGRHVGFLGIRDLPGP